MIAPLLLYGISLLSPTSICEKHASLAMLQMFLTLASSASSICSMYPSVLLVLFHLSAKLVLGKALYEYVASGTDDEQSEDPDERTRDWMWRARSTR